MVNCGIGLYIPNCGPLPNFAALEGYFSVLVSSTN